MRRLLLLLLILFSTAVFPQEIFKVNLPDEANKPFSFFEIKANKASVIIFFDTDCPLCKNYTLTVNELSRKYSAKGIQFYLAFPGRLTGLAEIKNFKEYYRLNVKTLHDNKHELLKILKAKVTPEVFVLSNNAELLYSGAIDNWMYQTGKKRKVVTQYYLDDALTEIINGRTPKVKKNKAYGCIIEY